MNLMLDICIDFCKIDIPKIIQHLLNQIQKTATINVITEDSENTFKV